VAQGVLDFTLLKGDSAESLEALYRQQADIAVSLADEASLPMWEQ
jgi:hypothetical protein